jgi:iron complex outermembrane receptor protein
MMNPHAARRAAVAAMSAVACCMAKPGHAIESLDEIVVTASRMQTPLTVITDPKAPRQPLPANDGADYLKTIPGFSVIRKGGTGGDPVLRGMAASRINVVTDGEALLGGCGMRMDPPTAYVFPEAYDRIVVTKGPQTVLNGPGNSAGTVSFERDVRRFESPGIRALGSALGASFGRTDLVGDLRVGTPYVYGQLTATGAESDDYEDGAGEKVHSAYRRWSANGALGWTPDAETRLELSGARSDGEAAYADRAMDGAAFDRDNLGLRFERDIGFGLVRHVDGQAYYNYVDHVMDNFSLRDFTPTPMMPNPAVSNPDRRTVGGRIALDLAWGGGTTATVGADLMENQHSLRSTMNETLRPYRSLARDDDAWFRSIGVFGEAKLPLDDRARLIAGLRADRWRARDEREYLQLGMMSVPNPTAGDERDSVLPAVFVRYERDLHRGPTTAYAGVGHVQRFPDYWELLSAGKESANGLSAFDTRPEKTTQLDAGIVHEESRLSASISAFYGVIDDYVLIETNFAKGARYATVTRNVDGRTWGAEADATYAWSARWSTTGTLAYTRGDNLTDDRPLAQMPPLEVRLGVDYRDDAWSAGALWRVVAAQERYAIDQGTVVGQDLGRTDSFSVLSLNAGWRSQRALRVTAGIDNILDELYAEPLSRGGALVPGFAQTTRVNEPGRTLWVKFAASFE